MATVKEITTLCKAGQVQEAYALAQADMAAGVPWAQQNVGWALYYMMKDDTATDDFHSLTVHLVEVSSLSQLSYASCPILFDCIASKIAAYTKENIAKGQTETFAKLDWLFAWLRPRTFGDPKGRAFLLSTFIKYDGWEQMLDFIDWWGLNYLTAEDYTPFKTESGRTLLSLAERAYIAKSKALLLLADTERTKTFLPELENVVNSHPEMTYPGYFYGKLLISTGGSKEETLKVVLPFARKKASEFWVWQMMADIFADEPDKQLACLQRAVSGKTPEDFLGKARTRLAALHIQREEYDLAKWHIDKVTRCYLEHGWRLPPDINSWIGQPWFGGATPRPETDKSFKETTNSILYDDASTAIAIVTYVDSASHKTAIVFGKEKSAMVTLNFETEIGDALRLKYIAEDKNKIRVVSAEKTDLPTGLDYVRKVHATVKRLHGKDYAFLTVSDNDIFVSPNAVSRFGLTDGEHVTAVIARSYNKKRQEWGWTAVRIEKSN